MFTKLCMYLLYCLWLWSLGKIVRMPHRLMYIIVLYPSSGLSSGRHIVDTYLGTYRPEEQSRWIGKVNQMLRRRWFCCCDRAMFHWRGFVHVAVCVCAIGELLGFQQSRPSHDRNIVKWRRARELCRNFAVGGKGFVLLLNGFNPFDSV